MPQSRAGHDGWKARPTSRVEFPPPKRLTRPSIFWLRPIIMEGLPFPSAMTRLLKNENGATAIEYGLIVALIAVAVIPAFRAVGSSLTSVFNNVASTL